MVQRNAFARKMVMASPADLHIISGYTEPR